ncbi:cytochrome d ubiquinol oxidase subunit II [Streptomyces paradoxus]|uniref:cytochrome d ubiquinol oxidase subunit II n=1 Tax=Streptomyces paradoxus TaxID=66375 RepID=UPI0037CE6E8A
MSGIWFALILLCLLMYVVLDGYDLGIGIATLFERDDRHRFEMLEQVALAWDGNETWLVLLGVSLWAGFPLAFGTVLPYAYLPLVVMLFSLIVRGVAVEMASQAPPGTGWQRAFGVASLTASLAQGATLGVLTAGHHDWFPVLTAAATACGYLALGCAHLKRKTTGGPRARTARTGIVATLLATALGAACLAAVGRTAAPLNLHGPGRAIAFAGLLLFAASGVVTALVTLRPTAGSDTLPFAGLATATVALALAVAVARYPVILPPALTVSDSVAPRTTMVFLAVGIGLNMPLILFYNWFAHHAFRHRRHGELTAQGQE